MHVAKAISSIFYTTYNVPGWAMSLLLCTYCQDIPGWHWIAPGNESLGAFSYSGCATPKRVWQEVT